MSFLDDRDEEDDRLILIELENVDDELDKEGIHIVKICDEAAAKDYGIEQSPALVYFEHEVRNPSSVFEHERHLRAYPLNDPPSCAFLGSCAMST